MSHPSLHLQPSNELRERRPSSNVARATPLFALSRIEDRRDEVPEQAIVDEDDIKLNTVADEKELPQPSSDKAIPASELLYSSHPSTSAPTINVTPDDTPQDMRVVRLTRRTASAFSAFFACGWADGTPGTILPYLERDFHLSFLTVSLLFVSSTVGFAIGTLLNEPLIMALGRFSLLHSHRRYIPDWEFLSLPTKGFNREATHMTSHSLSQGRFWTLLLAALLQLSYFAIAASRPSFAGMIVAFCLGGVATSLVTGQLNAYVSSVPNSGQALGRLHGFYGIGAFASPLVCQTLLGRGLAWPTFYWTSFGLSVFNSCLVIWSFHPSPKEHEVDRQRGLDAVARVNEEAASGVHGDGEALEMNVMSTATDVETAGAIPVRPSMRRNQSSYSMPESTMKKTLRTPFVWIFAIFLCMYTGSETTVGGWTVTFLLGTRHANPATVGYVASGFWGGLALGRLFFGQLSPRIGITIEKHLVHVFILVAVVMEILVWFIPSFIGNAVCVAVVGFVLGPLFPISLSLATKILPPDVHMTALSTMSSFASIGSALFPFITGALANAKGVRVVQPIVLVLLSGMAGLWFLFPSRFGPR